MRRLAPACILILLALLPAGARAGDPAFKATATPTSVSFGSTKEITYRLQMTGSDEEERFFVFFSRPTWGSGGPIGSPVGNLMVGVEGGAKLGKLGALTPEPPAGTCIRGYEPWGVINAEVTLAPGTDGALVVKAETGAAPYLRGTPLSLGFQISPGGGTVTGVGRVETPGPTVSGPTGVNIKLRAKRARVPGARKAATFTGTTNPLLARQKIELRYSFKRKDVVKTDRRGRFTVKGVKLPTFGKWRAQAFFKSRIPSVVTDDKSCPVSGF
jgi:hypothetical protein